MLNAVNYRRMLRACGASVLLGLGVGCAIAPPQGSTYGQPIAEPPDVSQPSVTVPTNHTAADPTADAGVCPPAQGNDQGVGVRCTKGGGQCDDFNAQFCTADYTKLPIHFCTTFCDANTNCGAGATCAQDPSETRLWACMPNSCVIVQPTTAPPNRNACLPQTPPASGLGTPCTASGGECRNLTAGLCTVDALPSSPFSFCTYICKTDSDCGGIGTCFAAPGGIGLSICVPTTCLP